MLTVNHSTEETIRTRGRFWLNVVWPASPSTHTGKIWFHSYSISVHGSDFWGSLVEPIKWQNARKPTSPTCFKHAATACLRTELTSVQTIFGHFSLDSHALSNVCGDSCYIVLSKYWLVKIEPNLYSNLKGIVSRLIAWGAHEWVLVHKESRMLNTSQTQHIKKGMLTFNWQSKSSTLSSRKSISWLLHQTPATSSLFFSLHSELNMTCFTSEESSGFTDDCFKTVMCHMYSLKQLHWLLADVWIV